MLKKVLYCIYYLGTVDNDYVASFEISELIPGGNFISLFLPAGVLYGVWLIWLIGEDSPVFYFISFL
jgi:hypothetical protein